MKKLIYLVVAVLAVTGASVFFYDVGEHSIYADARNNAWQTLRGFRASNLITQDGVESWRPGAVLPEGAEVVIPLDRLGRDDIYLAIRLIYGGSRYVVLKGDGGIAVVDLEAAPSLFAQPRKEPESN